MPGMRILPDHQHQLQLRHVLHHPGPPGGRAFTSRRQVAALRIQARKTEPHRHDGELARIIELRLVHPEPVAQPVAGRIGERPAALVHPRSRRLAGDQDRCTGRSDTDRARLVRQGIGGTAERGIPADPAGRDIGQQRRKRLIRVPGIAGGPAHPTVIPSRSGAMRPPDTSA